MTALDRLAHFLALILRHEPDRHGLALDARGFAPLDAVWRAVEVQFPGVYALSDVEALAHPVQGERPFEIAADPPRIRARWGHSRAVRPIEYDPSIPPEILFCVARAVRLERLRARGLLPGSRQYVHLIASPERAHARAARRREAEPVVLSIRADAAHQAGIVFHHAGADRYLARFIPPRFIQFPVDGLVTEADWLIPAVRTVPDHGLLVIDLERRVRAAIGTALHRAGIDPEQVIGQIVDRALPPDQVARIEPLIAGVFDGKTGSHRDSMARRTLLYRSFPLRRADGSVYAALIHLQDVTEQQRIEDALRESQRFIERVTAAMPDAVYVYDLIERRSIYNNREIAHILGYTPEAIESMGSAVMERLLHPDDYARQRAGEARFWQASDGDVIESAYRMRHADGSWRWVNLRDIIFQRDEQGRPTHILGIAQDITDQRSAQEAALERERLRAALQKEHELSDLKTRMMQRISHEFRTPLAIIQTSAELLGRYFERLSEVQRREQIDRIKQEIAHLAKMLDDVSLVVSGGIHRGQPVLKPFDLRQDVHHLVAQFSQTAHRSIEVQTPEEALIVRADRSMIHALIHNLLSNAVKFSRRERPIALSLSRCADDATVELNVVDQGIGIPEADMNHIAEAFYRGSNIGEINGIGIGLTVVRQVVDAHQGSLLIESRVGAGTRVSVRLPICAAQDAG
jgi:PAS domain S-box-containing protein